MLSTGFHVSMKSGLRDRNNGSSMRDAVNKTLAVSMKSDLRDRNNIESLIMTSRKVWPSQWSPVLDTGTIPVTQPSGQPRSFTSQ